MEMKAFKEIISRHGLLETWKKFVVRFELEEHGIASLLISVE
jgi:hypothetical protein